MSLTSAGTIFFSCVAVLAVVIADVILDAMKR